jgi:Kdo2-lipid IVA lauroyltransferase/acyltransferase
MILYYLLKLLSFAAANLPAAISYSIASAVGDLAYCLWPRGRRNMSKSIAAVLRQEANSREVQKNVRDGLRNYYKSVVDVLRYASPKKGFFETIDIIGLENVERAFSAGKGVLIIGLHMGNLDLGVRALSQAGYPINAIVQNLGFGPFDRFVQGPREASGLKLISESEGILQVLNILKKNEALALMIDGRCFETGFLVHLGNKYIMVPSGLAALALKTGARVLPCGLIRSSNTRFHGIVCKPVEFKPTGDFEEDARELTQQTVRVLEGMARIFADQWYIFHDLIRDDVRR